MDGTGLPEADLNPFRIGAQPKASRPLGPIGSGRTRLHFAEGKNTGSIFKPCHDRTLCLGDLALNEISKRSV